MKNKKQSWIKSILSYDENQKGKWIISIILSIISVVSGIIPYFCMYKVLDEFIYRQLSSEFIVNWCIVGVIAYAIKVVCFGLSTGLSHSVAYNVLEGLRISVANSFLKASLGDVQSHSIGQIKNVFVDKIENIEPPLAHIVPEGTGHLILPIVSIVSLAIIDFRLALASLVTFPLAILLMGLAFKISGKNFDKYNEANSYMSSTIIEYVEGIEVIKAFGRTGASYQKFSDAITGYSSFVIKWLSSTFFTMKLAFALFPATLLGVLPMALYLANNEIITISQGVLSVLLSMSMVTSLVAIEVFSENLRQIERTTKEVQEFLELKPLPEPAQRANIKNNNVELKNVSFSYTGDVKDEVLHNVSLTLPQGSFTAVVGPSGGGKSTIAKLIARFWDTTKGSIYIGGTNIKDIPLSQLSELVSFVAQDSFLFNCSILENIRLGNPSATDKEVMEAAKAAQCEEFISKLPNGYNTSSGEAGKQLSGGEKQRISIARMILKNAPIIILDEATAFTDPENEAKIQESLKMLTKGKTLLVIAHRLSTIKNANNIVVLENGKILAQGTQEQLLENCTLYKNMWETHIGVKNWAVGISIKEVKQYV